MVKLRVFVLLFGFLTSAPGFAADAISAETMIEQVMPAIVAIRADTPEGVAAGTGFLVESTGVVVTNLHVIEGATRVAIKLHSGEQYTQIRVASFDQSRDLAILRLPGFDLPTVSLGNSDSVKVGATVYAIGNPLGLEESVTKGIVSSIRVRDNGTKVIQTDSAVSSGNSGGPLINEKGHVVGVVTFKISSGENLNFAVPINYVRALLSFEQLITLDQLALELGKTEVSLFTSDRADSTLNGDWLSLTSNTHRKLRQEGDYLYGTYDIEGSDGTYDLTKQQDGSYTGMTNWKWECWYEERRSNRVDRVCSIQSDTELTMVTPRRIEGRILNPPDLSGNEKRIIKACKTCLESEKNDFFRYK